MGLFLFLGRGVQGVQGVQEEVRRSDLGDLEANPGGGRDRTEEPFQSFAEPFHAPKP